MSKDIFIKILGSNESGYSGDRPNQRGKFILISKEYYQFFPYLSEHTLNDQTVIRCKTPSDNEIAVNIVYHNAKFFPETHSRDHNEVRLYRNTQLDDALNLDRGVVVIATKFDDGSYGFVSIQKDNPRYSHWCEVEARFKDKVNNYDLISDLNETRQLMSLNKKEYKEVQNTNEVIGEFTRQLIKTRKQQPEFIHKEDPAKNLQSMFKSQEDFKKYIRLMYDGRCALRGSSLIINSYKGLEAAHIHPHSQKGPLLPSNGILLSRDLHSAFEHGYFTLSKTNNVMVSKKVPAKSNLWRFDNKKVKPVEGFEVYEPFRSYTEYHRDEIFENFRIKH